MIFNVHFPDLETFRYVSFGFIYVHFQFNAIPFTIEHLPIIDFAMRQCKV